MDGGKKMSNTEQKINLFCEGVEIKLKTLEAEARSLSILEIGNVGINTTATYDETTNKYILQRGDSQVSLYSTATLLDYYFGDNLDAAIANGSLSIVSRPDGYDIIVFENSVIGFGASNSVIENNDYFEKFTEDLVLDLASEYISKYLEINIPLAEPGFTTALAGCGIFSSLNGDSEKITTIDETQAIELVKSLTEFMDYVHGSVAGVVIDDYTDAILSNSNVYGLADMSTNFALGNLAHYDAGFTGTDKRCKSSVAY